MPKVPYPYELNGKLVTGNGSLILICSLSNSSLVPSLTVPRLPKYHLNYLRLGSLREGYQTVFPSQTFALNSKSWRLGNF